MDKFHGDVEKMIGELFKVEPFKSRKQDFNVRAVETPSIVSGVNKPHPGIFNRTPLSMSYSAFDSERYALTYDNRSVRNAASEVPYEFMFILMNERTYGGGGIYRLYATVAADNAFSDYIFVHEFGHHFAALADEYYSSAVSYEIGEVKVEPWEANVTALPDPSDLKWQGMVESGTPIPTPWPKEEFDAFSYEIQKKRKELRSQKAPEEKLEALFNKQKEGETKMLENFEYSGKVGAYEGANYMQHGMYRSYPDCIMFTRNHNDFCPACQRAIGWVIDQYTE
ncbi:MAG: M64 family metallopeptidase [Bacteroidota bacterium]|nr:M64 family metallopeptidase [Bacteroidota bacterium]